MAVIVAYACVGFNQNIFRSNQLDLFSREVPIIGGSLFVESIPYNCRCYPTTGIYKDGNHN